MDVQGLLCLVEGEDPDSSPVGCDVVAGTGSRLQHFVAESFADEDSDTPATSGATRAPAGASMAPDATVARHTRVPAFRCVRFLHTGHVHAAVLQQLAQLGHLRRDALCVELQKVHAATGSRGGGPSGRGAPRAGGAPSLRHDGACDALVSHLRTADRRGCFLADTVVGSDLGFSVSRSTGAGPGEGPNVGRHFAGQKSPRVTPRGCAGRCRPDGFLEAGKSWASEVIPFGKIKYVLEDGRQVETLFDENGETTKVTTTFDAENENPIEMQKGGWQAILNNFKKYVE